VQADGPSDDVAISEDGRFIAFTSSASNLTNHTPNGFVQVYLRDMLTGTVELLSVNANDQLANANCSDPLISSDGKVAAFATRATNLIGGDENSKIDIYVRDRNVPRTELVSLGAAGQLSTADAWVPALSGDGQVVAWVSGATNLTGDDSDTLFDIFVRDRPASTTVLASVDSSGSKRAEASWGPSLSADGSSVVFDTKAALSSSDQNGMNDIFLRDLANGRTTLVSVSSAEAQSNSFSSGATISADGDSVVFASQASNLVSNDSNSAEDLFVRVISAGTTERVNVSSAGAQADSGSYNEDSSISANGRFVAFTSNASTLVTGDTNGHPDIFVHDRVAGGTYRVSVTRTGGQANDFSENAAISGDGEWVAFDSFATNLVPGDDNVMLDVFVAAVP
jgi:Tol biopolymer transport system component